MCQVLPRPWIQVPQNLEGPESIVQAEVSMKTVLFYGDKNQRRQGMKTVWCRAWFHNGNPALRQSGRRPMTMCPVRATHQHSIKQTKTRKNSVCDFSSRVGDRKPPQGSPASRECRAKGANGTNRISKTQDSLLPARGVQFAKTRGY